jgi:HlyD family secretion protein
MVKRGDTVQAGQVLAELNNKAELAAAVQHAASRTEVARKRLAQARASAKPSDIAAQQAEIERLETELANARADLKRYSSLGTNVSSEELDRQKLRVDSTTSSLTAARQRLTSLTEVRAVDVDVAQAELEEAIRAEASALADAKTSTILAPSDGRVIEIHAWPGEQVGPDGILELAPNAPMYAVAEIAEVDAARVRVGQRATISGGALDKPLQGAVERISPKVLQNQIMPVSPTNFSDSRVIEVWIRIDDSNAVADRIHMRVDVVIQS